MYDLTMLEKVAEWVAGRIGFRKQESVKIIPVSTNTQIQMTVYDPVLIYMAGAMFLLSLAMLVYVTRPKLRR